MRVLGDHEKIHKAELRGFSRTLADIEWLLTILVLLYIKLPGTLVTNDTAVLLATIVFAFLVLFFHYLWVHDAASKLKLALETWVMIAFITFVVWHTGRIESPLLSLYLLVIITSAIALGKNITLLEVSLITACCLFLSFSSSSLAYLSLKKISGPLIQLFPLWFVAYLASMLSHESDQAKEKIFHLSQADSLTGLWNLRAFSSYLELEFKRSRRHDTPFSVMMLDADNLKPVNDSYGHKAGNVMIQHIATTMKEVLRETDIVARFGGDEFAGLLPDTKISKAIIAAERMREAIEKKPILLAGTPVPVTVSIGIASYPEHGDDATTLLKKADVALYQSKKEGKNKTTIFSDE